MKKADTRTTWRPEAAFVLCIRNDGFPASLERLKLYRRVRDPEGEAIGRVRVIDESGDDYLYPGDFFVPVELPRSLQDLLADP